MTGRSLDEKIRLTCFNCDRVDADGITFRTAFAVGWTDIDPAEPVTESVWWTHIGCCPDCERKEMDTKQSNPTVLRSRALTLCDICSGREAGEWNRRATRLSPGGKWTHDRIDGLSATMKLCAASDLWTRLQELKQ